MADERSVIERAAGSSSVDPEALAAALIDAGLADLPHIWAAQARQSQVPPGVDWDTWLILAGRGSERPGPGWVHQMAVEVPGARIALLGATAADARAEDESGLLAKAPTTAGWYSSHR